MKVPEANWLAIGIVMGTGLGVTFDNIGIGIALGTAIGAMLDSVKKK